MRDWFLAFLGTIGFFGIVLGLIALGVLLSSINPVIAIVYGLIVLAALIATVITA